MDKESNKKTKKVRDKLFLTFDIGKQPIGLRDSIKNSQEPFKGIGDTFMANTSGTVSTLSLPFNLIVNSVYSRRFQALHIAEKIRSGADPKKDGSLSAKIEEATTRRARKAIKSKKETDCLKNATIQESLMVLSNEGMNIAVAELLRQGIVLTWTSFEVFVRDFFRAIINSKCELAVQLSESKETRDLFQIKSVPFALLAEKDFNIKQNLGDLMLSNSDLDSILTIKKVFKAIFPDDRALHRSLESKVLWNLSRRRNLIVHHKGIIDQRYLSATGDSVPLGSQLIIKPDDIEGYILSTSKVVKQMLIASQF